MGLDMYLNGSKFLFNDWSNEANNQKEDGFRIKEKILQLGYWRKHPNLHGYLVREFMDGKDECQQIELDAEALYARSSPPSRVSNCRKRPVFSLARATHPTTRRQSKSWKVRLRGSKHAQRAKCAL